MIHLQLFELDTASFTKEFIAGFPNLSHSTQQLVSWQIALLVETMYVYKHIVTYAQAEPNNKLFAIMVTKQHKRIKDLVDETCALITQVTKHPVIVYPNPDVVNEYTEERGFHSICTWDRGNFTKEMLQRHLL